MSKKAIDFSQIDPKALVHLQNFAAARIAIAKEDQRHKEVLSPLKKQLEALKESRENDINAGLPRDEVLIKYSTVDIDNAIRKENDLHKEITKPLNEDLKSTYAFVPEELYEGYKRKMELQKRGEYLNCLNSFLQNLGITETSQSALCKLAEQITDYIGVSVSTSKKLLEDRVFTCVLKKNQFNRLFMSIFCDIITERGVIDFCF